MIYTFFSKKREYKKKKKYVCCRPLGVSKISFDMHKFYLKLYINWNQFYRTLFSRCNTFCSSCGAAWPTTQQLRRRSKMLCKFNPCGKIIHAVVDSCKCYERSFFFLCFLCIFFFNRNSNKWKWKVRVVRKNNNPVVSIPTSFTDQIDKGASIGDQELMEIREICSTTPSGLRSIHDPFLGRNFI